MSSLLVAVIGATIIAVIGAATDLANNARKFGVVWVALVLVLWLLIGIIRWLCCWRNLKKALFGLACVFTLIALFYAEEDWRGKHDWEKFKHRWEAKGEHFDYASLAPPAVPNDENFAMAPIWVESIESEFGTNVARQWYGKTLTKSEQAKLPDPLGMQIEVGNHSPELGNWTKSTLTDLRAWQKYYRSLATRTNLFPVASHPQTPAQDVLLALSRYAPAIEKLRQADKLPYSRFPVFSNPDRPFDTLLPHLAIFKRITQVLELQAVAEWQNGETNKALADVKLALDLGEKIRNEPFLITHLVRLAMLQITLQPIYEGLAEHKWSDAQLAQLDEKLAKLDFLADYERSMRGERNCSLSALDYMRRTRQMILSDYEGDKKVKLSWLIPSAFYYQNELTIARIHQQYTFPMADVERQVVSPDQVRRLANASREELNHHWSPYKIFAQMLLPAVSAAVMKFAYGQSSVNLARTAIALERYRLAHGEYPESLDALAPKCIAQVPHDVINGGPLRYRRSRDGQFVLYSVGWNERDDGGVVVYGKGKTPRVDIYKGDWVWRYPRK